MKPLLIILLMAPALAQISSRSAISSKVSVGIKGSTGGSLSITVVGTSNTFAVLSYTAPSSSACTVEVSESNTYSPLVNDVNGSLYTNANQDDRDGNLGAGTTSRVVKVGTRTSAVALDTVSYSRALQAYTTHYARVTCGASVGTTSFTTANVPGGSTYADYPYPFSPGVWGLPTFFGNDRTANQIDQFTGAYMKALTIWDDRNGSDPAGFNMADGGFVHMCTAGLQTSTMDGSVYVCQLFGENNNTTVFFAIRPSDGFVRNLGHPVPAYGPVKMGTDMCFSGAVSGDPIVKYCYNGDWGTHSNLPVDGGTTYSSVSGNSQVAAFDSGFDATKFSCPDLWALPNQTQQFQCSRNGGIGQDGYGYTIAYWGGDGRVYGSGSCGSVTYGGNCPGVVGSLSPAVQAVRFQSLHNFQPMPNVPTNPTIPMMVINWQNLANNSHINTASWSTTLTNNLNGGNTTMVVDTCPTSEFSGGDSFSMGCWNAGGGDAVNIGPGNLTYTTAATGSGPYTLTIPSYGGGNVSAGAKVYMAGNALNFTGHNSSWRLTYWKYASDPFGAALVLDDYFDPGGHYANGLDGRVSEETVVSGDISTQLNTASSISYDQASSPQFHGLGAYCFGSLCNKHPSYEQTTDTPAGIERNHFSDGMTWNGGYEQFGDCSGTSCTNATNITGTLYKYKGATTGPYNATYPANKTALFRKAFPTVAISGDYPYVDISGPSSHIVSTSGDNGKYCVAYLAGECRNSGDTGGASTAGDIYFNPPYTLDYLYCTGADGPVPNRKDICIASYPAYGRAAAPQFYQAATSNTDMIRRSRVLAGGVRGVRQMVTFSFAKILADASWYMIQAGNECTPNNEAFFCNIWLAKNMPFPSQDAYDRSDFIPTTTGTITGGGSVNNVVIQFGYLEFGTVSQFYCTSRAESCYVNSASIPSGANPYSYPSDGSANTLATLTGVSCTSTCTIDIPALSGHALYWRIIKRDASNGILSTGDTQLTIVP